MRHRCSRPISHTIQIGEAGHLFDGRMRDCSGDCIAATVPVLDCSGDALAPDFRHIGLPPVQTFSLAFLVIVYSAGPLHRAFARSPSPALRAGADKRWRSRDRLCPRFAHHHAPKRFAPATQRGSGAPKGASNQMPRSTASCRHEPAPRARRAHFRGALAFRRSAAALAGALTSRLSSRPCFLGRGSGGRYPPSPVPVQGQHLPPRSSCRRA
jgi:hypothetical protein